MAERRMFTRKITNSDAFLDMPLSTQALYFHINMEADDEGFVNNPKKIQRMIGASDDDLKLLIMKNFLIRYDSGVIVIKHWRMHNYIQKDRFHPTVYAEERSMLEVKKNGAYSLPVSRMDTECIQNVSKMDTEVRLGKDSIGKDSIGEKSKDKSLLSCPVPATQDTGPAFISLPLNDKTEYEVPLSDVEEYKKLYPAVDVEQELRNMRGWCLDSPSKRKTRNGIKRFIGSWLKREQDRGHAGYQTKGLEEFING